MTESASEHAIFIHSHRRSGTHFLLDTMRAWFDVPDQIQNRWLRTAPYSLSKDHEPYRGFKLAKRHMSAPAEQARHERRLYEAGKHIYIVRNPLQVLRSAYIFDVSGAEQKFRVDSKTSFFKYLTAPSLHEGKTGLNRIEYWVTHVKSWYFDEGTFCVHFDDLKGALADTLAGISEHIGLPVRKEPRSVAATGVATHLTKKFFAKGRTLDWDAEAIEAVGAAVERILGPKPWRGLERYMAKWLSDPPLAS